MNPCNYTNRGEEVALGVECALPYLLPSTPPPVRCGAQRTSPPRRLGAFQRRREPAWKRLTLGVC